MPKVCEEGSGGGLLLPIFGDAEQRWPPALRGILYGLGLAWCFMGVAIIADVFMGGIERITSKKVRNFNKETKRYSTTPVWNATVANLTLMALGSSAPEILLSIIELLQNKFFSGELGPSCIVGSAAFNLLVISGVCIAAIPTGQIRRIKEIRVYMVTAFFSVFAYIWLLIILLGSSKNAVTPWEGVVTFLFFPLNVLLAYLADVGVCAPKIEKVKDKPIMLTPNMTPEEILQLDNNVRQQYGAHLTAEQVSSIVRAERGMPQTRAQRRIAATRQMVGGRRVKQPGVMEDVLKQIDESDEKTGHLVRENMQVMRQTSRTKVMPSSSTTTDAFQGACIEFSSSAYAVLENAGSVRLFVRRTGNPEATVTVSYVTTAGEGKSDNSCFKKTSGKLVFKPREYENEIEIEIQDDKKQEDAESFTVHLRDPVIDFADEPISLGPISSAIVCVIDDDAPGVVGFPQETVTVPEDVVDRLASFDVVRKQGCCGRITCTYKTEDNVAIAGRDYDEAIGTLEFEDGVLSAKIHINIKANARYESTEDFRLVLENVTGGAMFDPTMDGGSNSKVLTVYIEDRPDAKDRTKGLIDKFSAVNWDQTSVGSANWKEQWKHALFVNGGQDASDEDKPASVIDWVMHIITLPWKLLFALVPPPDYCGGWVCFFCALGMIGFVTAIISDIASLFGCIVDLPDQVTAITLVALGTSLPDTFASKTAATHDPFADASLGNITGSNSVNVFLGLGLPWMIGSIYWAVNGPNDEYTQRYKTDSEIPGNFRTSDSAAFIVKAGSLGFSVSVFAGCAIACIILLAVRRFACGGELGGGTISRYVSAAACVCLWLLYICLSIWKTFSEKE